MFSASRSPASLLLVCVPPRPTAAWLLLRSVVPYHSLFLLLLLRPSRQVRLLFLSTSLLSLGYPSPTPPSLFLAGYFDAQISGFRYPSPAPPRLFLTGYFDARVSLFRYPRAFFSLPVLVSLIVCLDALLFPTQPSLPGYLGGRLALCAVLRYACGFYRSAVFTAPLSPVFWGLCSSAALMLAAPQSSPTSGRLALVPPCGSPAIFTAPRFLPLRGFYRSTVFYRSAFAGFLGALLFRRPHACCPPVFTHFRAARSLCRLAVRLRFLPLRGFYRSAVFTAPRFLPLRFRRFFGGSALPPPSCLLPPSLRPLPGAPCGAGSSVASPVGRHSWPSFCTACLTTLGALPLISPVSLLCISYKLGDRRSSRLLSVGTRAPRVLPPPSGTSRRMEIRHFHHRLTEVPSVDMLIEAWNGSIYRWHGVSLWCGFLHIPQIHAPPVPETR